ncbi:MAG: GNAT family N-acetyltransferase [Candidatus Thiodiazotropha sp.]
MRERLTFDEAYREQHRLDGGERIRLRLVHPDDKAGLRKAFAELSATSRHKRFLAAKQHLSDEELRYFTEIDGNDHFALVAILLDEAGRESDGLGITRCVRLTSDPECAEVAITVVDRMQGKGIGRMLLERLVTAAVERGIKRFRFECFAHNHEMQRLVRKVCRVVDTHLDGEVMIVETDLPDRITPAALHAHQALFDLFTLLRALAVQTVDLQMGLGRATLDRTWRSAFGEDIRRHLSKRTDTKGRDGINGQ